MKLGAVSNNEFQVTEGQNHLLAEVGRLDDFYAAAVLAVEYAAEAITRDVATRGFRAIQSASEEKSDGSPVSSADRASHEVLIRELASCSPFPVVSEEDPRGVPDLQKVIQHPFFWLADPLDGTRDFLAGEKTFAVSLALMRVSNGVVRPYFGCISDPTEQMTWWGSRETPLVKRVDGVEVEIPEVSTSAATVPMRVLGSRSIPSDRMKSLYEFWKVTEITRMGSALKFALMAEGSFDVYPRFGPTSEWDTAAGQLLLEISGGQLVSLKTGESMAYGKPDWKNEGFLAMRSEDLMREWLPQVRSRLPSPR